MLSKETIGQLNYLHEHAEQIYGPIGDNYRGRGALQSEMDEVIQAFQSRDNERLYCELLDVANVATRWAQALATGQIQAYRKGAS